MKVFYVELDHDSNYYPDSFVCGIFSTKEKADQWIKDHVEESERDFYSVWMDEVQ